MKGLMLDERKKEETPFRKLIEKIARYTDHPTDIIADLATFLLNRRETRRKIRETSSK